MKGILRGAACGMLLLFAAGVLASPAGWLDSGVTPEKKLLWSNLRGLVWIGLGGVAFCALLLAERARRLRRLPIDGTQDETLARDFFLKRLHPGALITSLLVFLLVLAGGGVWIADRILDELAQERRVTREFVKEKGTVIREHLDGALSATYTVSAVLQQGGGKIARFDSLARQLMTLHGGVSALQLAPGGVIRQSVPLAGNEKAIGHDLLADPRRNREAFLARDTRRLTLAGPFELIQGGVAVVGRLPVFLPSADGEDRFWGFATALIRVPELIERARLNEFADLGYRYELARRIPGEETPVIFLSSVPGGVLGDPVRVDFMVPNGHWQLAVEPVAGWGATIASAGAATLTTLAALFSAALFYLLLRQPAALRRQVAVRTRELAQTNERLARESAERERVAHALEQSEARMRLVNDALPAMIAYIDTGERYRYHNQAFERWLGRSAQEIDGRTAREVLGAVVYAVAGPKVMAALAGQEVSYERVQRLPDGRELVLAAHYVPHRDRAGQVIGVYALLSDITALRAQEATLRKVSHAVEQSPVSVVITDAKGTIEYVNPCLETLTGYTREEVLGQTPRLFKSGLTPPEIYQHLWRTVLGGGIWRGEIQNRKKDGSLFWESEVISPLKDAAGAITHIIAVKEDVTARKESEAHLACLNRSLRLLTECNMALVRAQSEDELLSDICKKAVSIGGYRMAWVGYAEHDAEQSVRPVAWYGQGAEFLRTAKASWGDGVRGQGVAGRAIRSGRAVVIHNMAEDAALALWHEEIRRHGYVSCVGLPLTDGAAAFGALVIYAEKEQVFDKEEISLFEELAEDLAYGIVALRTRAKHERAITAMQESEEKFRSISASAQDAILMVDREGRITYWNPAAENIFGYRADEVLGRDMHPLLSAPQHLADAQNGFERYRQTGTGPILGRTLELAARRADGSEFPVELSISAVSLQGERHAIGIVRDISERKAYQEQLERHANFDDLTGLPNRNLLRDRVVQAIAHADRSRETVALALVDINNLRLVNESLGRAAGDQLLRVAAERLRECLRGTDTVARTGTDTVARLGGDEFVIVSVTMPGADAITTIISRVLSEMARPVGIGQSQIVVTCSIGVALYPRDGQDVDTLLRNAEVALHRAKEAGRGTYHFFTEDLHARVSQRLALEADLRQALEAGEFLLHYQPQVDIESGRIVGAEALVRWQRADGELVAPTRFISLTEQTGMIVQLGEWVLKEACRQGALWQRAGQPPIPVAVNLSAVQFRKEDLSATVERVLRETGLPASCLELEITESVIMRDPDQVVHTLGELKKLGVLLSIDDFGTGYSSLSYLRRFHVDKLKMDMSFVREITTSRDAAAIAAAIITLGRSMRLTVIAEGVETAEQLAALETLGCDEYQGYHFSEPLPIDAFRKLLGG